jgi:hypothetical protein
MKLTRESRAYLYSVAGHILLLSLVLILGAGCICAPDPDDIKVEPDCPGGKNAASSITIQFNLAGIRDVGQDKLIRVSGSRVAGQHLCFADGSLGTIEPAVQLSGQGSGTQNITNLQDGNWQVRVLVIGGASEPHPQQEVTGMLSPGTARTLNITGGPGGALQVTF